ncbi:MAG: sulfate adenylyltransferase subunit CysN [Steroidobacteraceae bacterium]
MAVESAPLGAPTPLAPTAPQQLLRFITCGSVDDGKSTLIGRLLYESRQVFDDQLAMLENDSKRDGTQGDELDFALLVDGLSAEREQGITIDVAYRFFATERRKFIVADTPGHEQYTRNMVTGASTAELAIILIDARKGVLTQTRRHSYLVSLLGIRRIVLAINKMDLVDYSQDTFQRIRRAYADFAAQIGLADIVAIPVSALRGDNIIEPAAAMPWYRGPTLMAHLERVPLDEPLKAQPFRMPVQWVNRPNPEFRGFSGLIVGGAVSVGDSIRVLPAGLATRVARIVTPQGDRNGALAGQSVTLTVEDQIDISRGDLLVAADSPAGVAERFEATIVWMSGEPMLSGRPYLFKCGTRTVTADIERLEYKINVNTLERHPAQRLELNEIGLATLRLDQPLAFDPYLENRDTGGFILIDRISNNTVGAGMLQAALSTGSSLHGHSLDVDKARRSAQKNHQGCVLWLTGVSGAGKSTIANLVEKKLVGLGRHTYLLDGDNVRHGLSRDLGFDEAGRVENVRRVVEVARLMVDAGLIVLVSLISPYRADRSRARSLLADGEFIEIFIDTALADAERRDPKGLYRRARKGELQNFTGIDSPYETPESPEIHIDTARTSAEQAAEQIVGYLRNAGIIGRDWAFIP